MLNKQQERVFTALPVITNEAQWKTEARRASSFSYYYQYTIARLLQWLIEQKHEVFDSRDLMDAIIADDNNPDYSDYGDVYYDAIQIVAAVESSVTKWYIEMMKEANETNE